MMKFGLTVGAALFGFAALTAVDAHAAPNETWEQAGPAAQVTSSRGYNLNVRFETNSKGKCYSVVDITQNHPVDPVWYSSSIIYVDMVKVGEDKEYGEGYGGPTSASWDNVTLNAMANGKVLMVQADGKNYIFGLKNSSRSLKAASTYGCNR